MSFDQLSQSQSEPQSKFSCPIRLAVMLSGSGTTLDNLNKHIAQGKLDATIPVVIASRECLGAEKARNAEIETHIHSGNIAPELLDLICEKHDIDLVILAGYLRLVPITDRVRGRVINIHPALLPAFGGKGMHGRRVHQAVIESAKRGEVSESGCTVHFADEHYDTGSVIVQLRCPIKDTDCAQELGNRVFELECIAYPQAINLLIERNARAHSSE